MFLEKVFFGATIVSSAAISTLGAIMTEGEERWIYITCLASIVTSGFMSLMWKRADDHIRKTVGRCIFAIMGGIFATKPVAHYFGHNDLAAVDLITLGGLASATCIATFVVGVPVLRTIERVIPAAFERVMKEKFGQKDDNV